MTLTQLAAKILLQKLRPSIESTPQKISHRESLSIKENPHLKTWKLLAQIGA